MLPRPFGEALWEKLLDMAFRLVNQSSSGMGKAMRIVEFLARVQQRLKLFDRELLQLVTAVVLQPLSKPFLQVLGLEVVELCNFERAPDGRNRDFVTCFIE